MYFISLYFEIFERPVTKKVKLLKKLQNPLRSMNLYTSLDFNCPKI